MSPQGIATPFLAFRAYAAFLVAAFVRRWG